MKRLIFEELMMMSTREKKARRIEFHPRTTIIQGTNDTGKSSLMKTLYHTLGATPPNFHQRWLDASVKSAIRFSVDKDCFTILRDGKSYTLFNAESVRIGTYTSVTKELAPALAKIFTFYLRLPLKKGDSEGQATPAFLFLPFYIDQDRGWNDQRASFKNLQQFGSTWAKDAMEYHTGIRPNEYYSAKGSLLDAQNEQRPVQDRRDVLSNLMKDLQNRLATTQFDISIETYGKEIEKLLEKSSFLREKEENLKSQLVSLYNTRSILRTQIIIATNAAKELASDFDYAANIMLEAIAECPTCGAIYENAFQERFSIAKDEDSCQQLIADLREELREVEKCLSGSRVQHTEKSLELQEIEKLLETKQGEVTLRDILENEGKKEVHRILENDVQKLNVEIGRLDGVIREMKEKMDKLTDRTRKAEIISEYSKKLREYLFKLNVQDQPSNVYKRVDSRIKETGSDLPRAILAYFFSILQVIRSRSSSTFCPVVIDSPNQQDQDPENLKRIFEFIRDEQPKESQLILSIVDPLSVKFEGKVVTLQDKYSVLKKEYYEEVAQEMRPLINASMME